MTGENPIIALPMEDCCWAARACVQT